MKKIINGARYDTETSRRLADWSNGKGENVTYENPYEVDPDFMTEILYITKTGNFFLHCAGGAETRYADIIDKKWSWSEKIQQLSESDAYEWAMTRLDEWEVEKIFEKAKEKENNVRISALIPESVRNGIDEHCAESGESISQLVTTAVDFYLRSFKV